MKHTAIDIGGVSPDALVKKYGSPLYVYDAARIQEQCQKLIQNFPGVDFFYACKANTNPEIVKLIGKCGLGIETVSEGEISVAKSAGIKAENITFTCGSLSEAELISVVGEGVRIHLDSLHQVELIGKHFPGSDISVRLNQGVGAGHHEHVITGGPNSKFGIDVSQVETLKIIADIYNLRITGLHQHIGSNILDVSTFMKSIEVLCATALRFPDLMHLDFGGGFGVPYAPKEKALDIQALGKKVTARLAVFTKKYGRRLQYSFEPGRYLVAEAGSLLVSVVDIKENPTKTFVGVNSGFSHLIRPAMYGSYHEILNATHPQNEKQKVTIAGNICESGDVFAKDRMLARPEYDDVLVIQHAGAYGYTMSSDYNLRPKPLEILVQKGKMRVIRAVR